MEACLGTPECQCYSCSYHRFATMQIQAQFVAGNRVIAYGDHYIKHCIKTPKRNSSLSGHIWVWELWHGNETRFFENMRMRKPILRSLIADLVSKGGLNPSPKRVTLEESIAIFLLILGQGLTYPVVEERLQCSSEMVHNHFRKILESVCSLGKYLIKPTDPSFQDTPQHISSNSLYWPYFFFCVGALDGTHIALHVPNDIKSPWMNRKGFPSTNVLAVCDFNMCVTYVSVGMEGSMHDARVLTESIRRSGKNFPHPPEGKYYLADAGYPLMPGFLTPYRKERYHLGEFKSNRVIHNRQENFNYRHSSLRSVIERTFGILKKCWRILNTMSMVPLDVQFKIIYACMVLHNFIRRYDSDDLAMLDVLLDNDGEFSGSLRNLDIEYNAEGGSRPDQRPMSQLRDMIKDSIPYPNRGIIEI